MVRNPTFPDDEVALAKSQAISTARFTRAVNNALGFRLLANALYGAEHPYGAHADTEAYVAALDQLTADDLTRWHATWVRPDLVTVLVTGDVDPDATTAELERAFGDWEAPAEPAPTRAVAPTANADGPRIFVVDRPEMDQSAIFAGRVIDEPRRASDAALSAMNEAFGGSFASRINMNIREDKGWSYGVGSNVLRRNSQSQFGLLAPVQKDRTADTIRELLREMGEFTSSRPYSSEDFDNARNAVVGRQNASFEGSGWLMVSMLRSNAAGRPVDFDATQAQRLAALTLEDVRAAAAEAIQTRDLAWVIIGDWDAIAADVEAIGLGPVTLVEH